MMPSTKTSSSKKTAKPTTRKALVPPTVKQLAPEAAVEVAVFETYQGEFVERARLDVPPGVTVDRLREMLATESTRLADLEKAASSIAPDNMLMRIGRENAARVWAEKIGLPFEIEISNPCGHFFSINVEFTAWKGISLAVRFTVAERKTNNDLPPIGIAVVVCDNYKNIRRSTLHVHRQLDTHEKFEDAMKAAGKFIKQVRRLRLQDLSALFRMMDGK